MSRVVGALLFLVVAHGHAFGQAEEAPAGYLPPNGVPVSYDPRPVAAERENARLKWIVAVNPRLVVALGTPAGLPRIGYGVGFFIGRALVVHGRLRLGLGAGFSFEHVQREKHPPMGLENGDIVQELSHFGFSLDLRIDGIVANGIVRPWVTIGPAFSVGDYKDPPSTENPKGIERAAVVPALRAALGIAFRVWEQVELGPRFEWLATFGGPDVGSAMDGVFHPGNFSVGLDGGVRF